MPPRAALGYLFGALIGVLERFGVGAGVGAGLDEAVTLMLCRGPEWQQQARVLARVLKGRLPVVYSTARLLDAVAVRWQAQLNENAKVLCHTHVLPEQNHNEIVGLGRPGRLGASAVVLALTDSTTHVRTRQRLGQMLDICRTGIRAAVVIEAEGRAALARLLSLVMLGDLVSVELARVLGEDAMAIARIDELKKRMASS
jgi:glucose/mannose-6-phosphate isomerase